MDHGQFKHRTLVENAGIPIKMVRGRWHVRPIIAIVPMEQKGTTAPKIERQSITPFFSILIENLRFRSWATAQTVQPGDLAIASQFRMNVGVCVVHGEEKRKERKEPNFLAVLILDPFLRVGAMWRCHVWLNNENVGACGWWIGCRFGWLRLSARRSGAELEPHPFNCS